MAEHSQCTGFFRVKHTSTRGQAARCFSCGMRNAPKSDVFHYARVPSKGHALVLLMELAGNSYASVLENPCDWRLIGKP